MKTTPVNTVIEKFNSLQLEEKELAMDIIKRAYAEALREDLVKRARKATDNHKKGKVMKGSVADLYNDLENS